MIQFLSSKLKKFIYRNCGSNELSYKIQELEKQIEQIKLQMNDTQVIRIEKIIVEKIVCEKFENNYKIGSITNENLSGTMNIGTIYPNNEQNSALNKEEKSLGQSDHERPNVNLMYK